MSNLGVAPSNAALAVAAAAVDITNFLVPVGTMLPWSGAEASIPAGWLLCSGQAVVRATYVALNALYSTATYPYGTGNGTTTFNLPDMRGRLPVGLDNMGGTDAGRIATANTLGLGVGTETHTISLAEMPAHSHGGVTGFFDTNHAHTGTFAVGGAHTHTYTKTLVQNINVNGGGQPVNASTQVLATTSAGSHSHTLSTGSQDTGTPNHQHTVSLEGGGGVISIMQPGLFMNWIVKT